MFYFCFDGDINGYFIVLGCFSFASLRMNNVSRGQLLQDFIFMFVLFTNFVNDFYNIFIESENKSSA